MNYLSNKLLYVLFYYKKVKNSSTNLLLLFAMVFVLSGCDVSLYEGLSEKQANTMLVTLLKNGIESEKVSQGKNGFSIVVDEQMLVQALDILKVNNLPNEDFQNFGNIFKGDSMIASSVEEGARMSFAISQELTDTISRIDGVLTSRVHIVLGSIDQATNRVTPPSAAIFIRHNPESTITNYVAQLREMTEKSVPNLAMNNISIMLMPVRESISIPRTESPTFSGAFLQTMDKSPYVLILLLITSIGTIAYLGRSGVVCYRNYKERKNTVSED